MEPHLRRDPPEFAFPPLLIVTPDSPRRTEREKYGGLFYLGLLGLITILALVGWFAYGVWSMRHVWRAIYVLHDEHHSEAERIEVAYTLGRDPRLNQRQLWEMSLRKPLPSLARYALAEALTAEATSADPRGYALTVARSPGWPDWLRVLLLRPMAYAAARGVAFPRAPLDELRRHPDPVVGLWAAFVLAEVDCQAADPRRDLERVCAEEGPNHELACLLLDALRVEVSSARIRLLDQATLWLRTHHAPSARLWEGWAVEGPRLVPRPAPKLPRDPSEPSGMPSRSPFPPHDRPEPRLDRLRDPARQRHQHDKRKIEMTDGRWQMNSKNRLV
jgi:hypothetical protein